jgi:hypothetical protein
MAESSAGTPLRTVDEPFGGVSHRTRGFTAPPASPDPRVRCRRENRMRLRIPVAGFCLALFALGAPLHGQPLYGQLVPAPGQSLAPFDVKRIVTQRSAPYSDAKAPDPPPLFVCGMAPSNSLEHAYFLSFRARPYPGSAYILGCFGEVFSEMVDVVPERFERDGTEIRLVFRYVVAEKPIDDARSGRLRFFGAPLPFDLPDGKYRLSVRVLDVPPGVLIKSSLERTFEKPDPALRRRQEEITALEKLPLDRWMDRYRAAVADAEPYAAPYEQHLAGYTSEEGALKRSSLIYDVRRAMVRRKLEISPYLIEALKEESVRSSFTQKPVPGIVRELMEMLLEIRDARAAPVLVDILAGRLRCDAIVRHNAIDNLEKLSFVSFRSIELNSGINQYAVFGPAASKADAFSGDAESSKADLAMAAKYERWFSEHPAQGADTSPWFLAACELARSRLESADIREVYDAAYFLRRMQSDHDRKPLLRADDWSQTTRRLAAVLEQCEPAGPQIAGTLGYSRFRHRPSGKDLPVTLENWLELLTYSRAVPEEHAALVIRLDREIAAHPGAAARYLKEVAGRDAMDHRIRTHRRLADEVARSGKKPTAEIGSLLGPEQELVWNLQLTRTGIERWSGRTFSSDDEIDRWWSAAKGKSQSEWLRDNLPLLAKQADAGDRRSQYLFRQLLDGALPNPPPPHHVVWLEPGWSTNLPQLPEPAPAFRVQWLAENASRLRYDPEQGVFQLLKPTPVPPTKNQP